MTHGTLSQYTNQGCRCPECKAAASEYNRGAYQRRKRGETPKREVGPRGHGSIYQYKQGCRCDECLVAQKASTWRTNYGLSLEDVQGLLQRQDYACPICEEPLDELLLRVDHNHATGEIRGVLCVSCNLGLGKFQDSALILDKAAQYLSSE